MNDPFLMLLVESLNLMHPRFAAAHPLHEFYHQFRRLWDKALPVQLGLGHIVVQDDPDSPPGSRPDLLIWRIGEGGQPDRRLGAVSLVESAADLAVLARYKLGLEYPHAVGIEIGNRGLPPVEGVARIEYDTQKRVAKVLES